MDEEGAVFESPRQDEKKDVALPLTAAGSLMQIHFPFSELPFIKDIKLRRNFTKPEAGVKDS